jgi:prevent-host-death family protein
MAKTASVHEAKTHLSRLINRVLKGEEVIISRSGKPVAKLVQYENSPGKRVPGTAKGLFEMTPDFDAPLPDDLLEEFEK